MATDTKCSQIFFGVYPRRANVHHPLFLFPPKPSGLDKGLEFPSPPACRAPSEFCCPRGLGPSEKVNFPHLLGGMEALRDGSSCVLFPQ